ncbi:hypothetical protein BDEG_20239 [Batrachochytrium dendrobatidis JEL423]|uniref:Propionyl-CoA synthetase n=1 Tax=Batrachochytrium dendrobatidis (strain JEL423) TaxID=403673 RepID=A0A177W7H5_BATDL|nr:hypothetical protein BDEG_20239 [Batrachochytrium dendrobatidis JEL423]
MNTDLIHRMDYTQRTLLDASLSNPTAFWKAAASHIHWFTNPTHVFDAASPLFPAGRWFADGQLNTCYNAIDRHVLNGRAHQTALIWDSAVTGTVKKFTYNELLQSVGKVARILMAHGVEKGTTVIIYMPLVPEAVFAMLACARLGAIHSVVFGGFAALELAKRIDDCKPKVILAASCGIEPTRIVPYKPLIDTALLLCKHKPMATIILQRPQGPVLALDEFKGEWDWNKQLELHNAAHSSVPAAVSVESGHPLYLLYTSGSTGTPKGVVRDNGGHAVALQWSITNIFGLSPGNVIFTASDIGWAVGHSFTVYGPLMAGCTTVLYEGKPVGTPDAGAFWRVVNHYKVNVLFTAPTAIRAIKRDDPEGNYLSKLSIPTLQHLFLAGERSDPDTIHHFQKLLGIPVRDHFWQTETGWPVTAPCATIDSLKSTPIRAGSAGLPVPGYDVRVLVPLDQSTHDDHETTYSSTNHGVAYREASFGEYGNLVVKLPLPPGCLPTLWNNADGFVKSYLSKFPGYFDLTDSGYIDKDGYVYIMSRTDDVINTAGHRLSTGTIEQTVSAHAMVAECAVVGQRDAIKGEKPVGFVILKHSHSAKSLDMGRISMDLVDHVRQQIGSFACFHHVYFVDRLPKTRSGKILRRTLRAMVNGDSYTTPPTIEDASVLKEIQLKLKPAHL